MKRIVNSLYKCIGTNRKLLREYYQMHNRRTENDKKSHIDYFRQLQHESSYILYQAFVEAERTSYIQANEHERNNKRRDHRNGYKMNKSTRIPGAEHLVTFTPQVRNFPKRFKKFLLMKELPKIFEKYIVDLITHGRSSNDIRNLLMSQLNVSISKTKILSILDTFEEEFKKWRRRKLKNDYPYIFIDGKWAKVRKNGEMRKMVYITVLGMNEDGEKEVLAFRLARSENTEDIFALLKNILMRGVKDVKLVTADGAGSMRKAAGAVWLDAEFQLCSVHKMRNIITNCTNKRRVRFMLKDAKCVINAQSFKEAEILIRKMESKWMSKEPKAMKNFSHRIEMCFSHLDVTDDAALRRTLRSTNPIERYFRETNKRLKELGYLRSVRRANLWYYQIIKEVSKKSKKYIWAF